MRMLFDAIIALVGVPAAHAGALDLYSDYWVIFGPGPGGDNLITAFANQVTAMVTLFIGGMATIGVLLGAMKIVTSGGNDEGKNKGKSMIIASLVGVALAVLGAGLVQFVKTFLNSLPS